MTFLSPFQALAEKWNEYSARVKPTSRRPDEYHEGLARGYEYCADELTELLGKVVVTDEMVERSIDAYERHWCGDTRGYENLQIAMRAAIEAALGVTKC